MEISQANDLYLEHYQFKFDPFAERSSSFQFYKAKRRNVLEQLIHFARYGNFLLLITGPRGSGKTVLRHAMVAAAKESALNIVISGFQAQDAGILIQHIAHGLKTEQRDIQGLLGAIEQVTHAGNDVHILVDDAHALNESAIVLLQRLAKGGGEARASVFLFGEPSLQTSLADIEQSNDEVEHHSIELEPWSAADIRGYLQTRLEAAGQTLDIFTDAELEQLCSESDGWPGLVNQAAKEVLMTRIFDQPRRKMLPPLPYKYLLALLAIAFIFIYFLYQQDEQKVAVKAEDSVDAPIERAMVSSQRVSEQNTALKTERVPLQLPLPEDSATASALAIQQAQAVEPTQPTITQQEAAVDVVEPPLEIALAEQSAPEPPPAPVVKQTPPPVAQPKPKPKPAPAAVKQPAPVKKSAAQPVRAATQGSAWYGQQPKQRFVLQVFASGSEQTAKSFVQRNGLQYHYFRKQHQGKYLYVVTYGSFASHEAAVAAARNLPAELRSNKPWPRTFASIVQEIN